MTSIQRFVNRNQHTLKKTLSYYVMHITVAMAVAYAVTGNFWVAMTLSLLEPTVQAFAFFFHEKVWNRKNTVRQAQEMSAQQASQTAIVASQ